MKKQNIQRVFVFVVGIISLSSVKAQRIISQQFYDVPILGVDGNQNALYWNINKSDSSIYFYATNLENGELWSIGKTNYDNLLKKQQEKTGAGKVLQKFFTDQLYQAHTFLFAWQLRLDKGLNKISDKTFLFRTLGSNSDTVLNFAKFGNIASLDTKYPDAKEGRIPLIDDFNKQFPDVPKVNGIAASRYYIRSVGSGFLGTKNMTPTLMHNFTTNAYIYQKGFGQRNEEKNVCDLRSNPELSEANYVPQSLGRISESQIAVWMVDNKTETKDRRKYRMVVIDTSGKIVKSYEYFNETSKNPVVANMPVYNRVGERTGFVSVFGYDYHSNKKFLDPSKNDLNNFTLLFFDNNGELKWTTNFQYGDDKYYKDVLTPLKVFEDNGKLIFLNDYITGLFKAPIFQIFSIDKDGNKQNMVNDEAGTVFKKTENALVFLSPESRLVFDGKNLWSYYFNEERTTIGAPTTQYTITDDGTVQTGSGTYKEIYVTKLDENFSPVLKQVLPITPTQSAPVCTFLEDKEGTIKYFVTDKANDNNYFLFMDNEKGAALTPVTSNLFAGRTPNSPVVFGNNIVIDRSNNVLYLLSEFYRTQNISTLILAKILISKIAY